MPNLRDIKKRIVSVESTSQITRTMEMVATAKIKKAQERIESARPYSIAMMEVLGNVAQHVGEATHPLLEEHPEQRRTVIVAITSDRGLCGAFNSNILRITEDLMRMQRAAGITTEVIAIGKKAVTYLRYRGIEPVLAFQDVSDDPTFAEAKSIAGFIIPRYEAHELDAAHIVFNRFKSVAEQSPETYQLLPIEKSVMESEEQAGGMHAEYIFEPSAAEVLEHLLPTYVETLVYRALMESAAAEHAARRTAMKSASDNASEMITTLTRSYNRARQSAITTEIAEIVGGAAALEEG